MQEIEYKFLVDSLIWEQLEKPVPEQIIQGYLSREINASVRIRIKNDQAFLTIKGKTVGITRTEFEYPILKSDAEYMLGNMIDKVLIKKRYNILYKNKTWEVDEFEGNLSGLILAELEVESVDEKFEIPSWIKKDVSTNPEYYNSNLIERC